MSVRQAISPAAWKVIQRVEDVVVARYREALTLAEIARAVDRHPAYISALYRRARGRTLTALIRELRVRHAASLLHWDALTSLEIAAASGFGSVSRFYSAFKAVTGHAPRAGGRGRRSATDAPPAPVGSSAIAGGPQALSLMVAWIDDAPENNIRERRALYAQGIAVDCFVDSQQALRALRFGGYALVITDYRRASDPHGGPGLARAIRAEFPTLPVLIYCGYDSPTRRQHAQQAGAAALFVRPADLVSAVVSSLRKDATPRKAARKRRKETRG
jgi:AraC-like DNA-binding protein